MKKYKTLMLNIAVFALNAVATKLITFFLVPIYTYYLSQSEYGITDMAQTMQMVLIPVVTLSIGDAVLRFAIDDRENINHYFSVGIYVVVLSSALVFCILPFLNLSIFGGLGEYKLSFGLVYIFGAIQTLLANMARALNELKLITISSIVTSLVTCITAILFIVALRLSVNGFLWSLTIGYASGSFVYMWGGKLWHYINFELKTKDWYLLKQMLQYSLPLIPNSLFWWVGTSINRFFIIGMIGIAASGLYAAASKIPNMLNVFYNIFQQAWTLSSFQEYKKTNIADFFSSVFRVLQSIMVLISALFVLSSQYLASLMLQKDFYQGWTLIPIMVFGFYANALNSFYGSVFTSSMKTRPLMFSTMVGGIVCIVFTWGLIYKFGLWGACIANAVSNIVVLVIRIFLSYSVITIYIPRLISLVSVFVLLLMVCFTCMQNPYWMAVDCCLLLALIFLQFINLYPIIVKLLKKSFAK